MARTPIMRQVVADWMSKSMDERMRWWSEYGMLRKWVEELDPMLAASFAELARAELKEASKRTGLMVFMPGTPDPPPGPPRR